MLEVRAEKDVLLEAIKAKAAAKREALDTRKAPAGGTSAEDGTAALEATTRAAALAAQHARTAALARFQPVGPRPSSDQRTSRSTMWPAIQLHMAEG